MKIFFFLAVLLITQAADAQFGKKLLEQSKEAARRKAEAKAQQKIDNAIDQGIDKADSVVTGKKKKGKKNKPSSEEITSPTNENSSGADNSATENASEEVFTPAAETITTPEGTPFKNNKLQLTSLLFKEENGSFDPDPNDDLNGAGGAIRQQMKTKKILVKVYQRSANDSPAKAEAEYNAIRLYLSNRFGLDEERFFFNCPAGRKDGPVRVIEFVAVPETFKASDAAKY